jgi:hypothetical protein
MSRRDLRVSVVIATYNAADLLAETLGHLTRQTLPSTAFEVIVGDDGSSDGTEAVVRSFADRLQIKYYFQEDRGFRAGAARNGAARLAAAPMTPQDAVAAYRDVPAFQDIRPPALEAVGFDMTKLLVPWQIFRAAKVCASVPDPGCDAAERPRGTGCPGPGAYRLWQAPRLRPGAADPYRRAARRAPPPAGPGPRADA